ncbi:MAG: type III-A CRISPR-associated RAMP protein Csm5 [Lachnospiraceae bacterium]|jgi:CRISPR-associated protein Csm5|nr:type III-A CRISPR-associated RAMP protein Csm5 [Lachnospiraceae bacterium]
MNKKMERVVLENLTPIHIGQGNTLTKQEYVFDKEKMQISIINPDKLIEKIENKGYTEKYMNLVKSLATPQKTLQNLGINIAEVCYKPLKLQSLVYKKINGKSVQNLNDIACFISDMDSNLYIPGSSIKGFLVTAIAYKYMLEHPAIFKGIPTYEDIEKEVFMPQGRKGRDLRSFIQVSDSEPVSRDNVFITSKEDLTPCKNIKINSLPIYREYIVPLTKFKFTMTNEYDQLSQIGIKSFDDILVAVQKFTNKFIEIQNEFKEMAEREKGYKFKYSAETELPNFMIGGGNGYFTKSLLHAIINDRKKLKDEVIKQLDASVKIHEHRLHDKIMSPRTIKLAKYNNSYYCVGMCKLSIEI